MSKKGSMELSVNSIVILVIAIVMLGLILGFVKSKFSSLDKQLVQDEPEAPSAVSGDELTISRETIVVSPGEEVTLKLQAFNGAAAPTASIKPTIGSCTPDVNAVSAAGLITNPKVIASTQVAKYLATLKISPTAKKGKNICTLSMPGFPSKDISIEVKN